MHAFCDNQLVVVGKSNQSKHAGEHRRATSNPNSSTRLTASSRMSGFKFKVNRPIGVHSMAVWVSTISEMLTLHRRSKGSWACQPCRDSRPRLRRPKEHNLRTKHAEGALGEGEHGVGLGAGPEVGRWERFAAALGGASAWVRRRARTQKRTRRRHKR